MLNYVIQLYQVLAKGPSNLLITGETSLQKKCSSQASACLWTVSSSNRTWREEWEHTPQSSNNSNPQTAQGCLLTTVGTACAFISRTVHVLHNHCLGPSPYWIIFYRFPEWQFISESQVRRYCPGSFKTQSSKKIKSTLYLKSVNAQLRSLLNLFWSGSKQLKYKHRNIKQTITQHRYFSQLIHMTCALSK